jgi:uncharacterized protein YdbL (DUF1318 family)
MSGAPVELVISLTCHFGLTHETAMEVVLDKARVQGEACKQCMGLIFALHQP